MVPMTAEQIEDYDRDRRQLYKQLVALGEIIEAHGGPKTPTPWVPTRELVPQGPNLELARLDDAPPSLASGGIMETKTKAPLTAVERSEAEIRKLLNSRPPRYDWPRWRQTWLYGLMCYLLGVWLG